MDYLILFKPLDAPEVNAWRVVTIISGLGKGEGERAIEQGASEGEGEYMAVPLDKATRLVAWRRLELAPSQEEAAA